MIVGTKTNPHIKDPNDVLDYIVDWNGGAKPFLGVDTILTSTWILPAGLTSPTQTNTTTKATVWLSGGTVGTKYAVLNRITTAGGRTADKTIYVKVKER